MLEDEVTDEDVRDRIVDAVEPFARDGAELHALVRDGNPGALEHRRRDVEP